MASDDTMKTVLFLGIAGVGLWWLYEQGYLYQWTGMASLAPSGTVPTTTPTTTTTTAPVTTTTTTTAPPTTTQPTTPSAATFQIVGAVTPNINNSLTANVSINGGSPMNITIIQSGSQAGTAWNTSGQNITSQLTAQGVNVAAILKAFQAAYSGSGGSTSTQSSSSSNIAALQAQFNALLAAYPVAGPGASSIAASLEALAAQIKAAGGKVPPNSLGLSGIGLGMRVPMRGVHGMGYTRVRRGWVV